MTFRKFFNRTQSQSQQVESRTLLAESEITGCKFGVGNEQIRSYSFPPVTLTCGLSLTDRTTHDKGVVNIHIVTLRVENAKKTASIDFELPGRDISILTNTQYVEETRENNSKYYKNTNFEVLIKGVPLRQYLALTDVSHWQCNRFLKIYDDLKSNKTQITDVAELAQIKNKFSLAENAGQGQHQRKR